MNSFVCVSSYLADSYYYHGCFLHFQCLLVVLSIHTTTTVVFFTFSGFLLSCRSILPRSFSSLSVASCCLADPYYHGRFLHFQWLLVVLSIHTTTVVFFTFSGFLLSCRSILPRSFSPLSVASCCLVDPYYHGRFLHFQWLLVVLPIHTTTVVFSTFSGFLLSCRSILLPRLFSSPSVASCCLADPYYYHGCFLHLQWLLVVLSVHTTTVVFSTFSGFLLSCRSILPRSFSPLSVASCCLADPYYHGCFLHFQWLLVVLSIHTTTVVFFTFSGFLLSCRFILLPRLFSSPSVASCCLVDPYYHGRFLHFPWLLVVLPIHTTTTVVFFTFSGFLLSCRSILPRLFSPLSVASCCLVGPYYHGCFLHFQWLLVVLPIHTTTVVFFTFSGFLLSCRSILPRSFSSLSVASCCLVDPYYHGRFLHFQWLLVVLPIHTTTVVFSTFSGFLLSCRSILPRSFSSLSVPSCCLADSYYYHGCFLHLQWLLVVLSVHTTTVVFSTFSGFLLSCRSILPRSFSSLSVASCCLADSYYYHGCFLHFQWLLVVLPNHTTTVVFFTFSGFLLSCRSILPRLFSSLSVASCCLVGPYYHGFYLHFQWLLVVLSIHTTTVVFFNFSGFLLSCRFILLPRLFSPLSVASCCLVGPYYHGRFLHFQWLLVVLSVHTTTVVFFTFSGFLLSCRSILPRFFSPLSVASCCLVDPYYHGRFLHFQWLLVVLSIHTTTVVFFTFSGFLLSCRSILPRSFSPLSVASCCLADPYYHGRFLHFQWLLVVLSIHTTTTVVFSTFSGFLLSCRFILLPRLFSPLSVASCCLVGPYYHGCFLHFQWLLVVLSIHTTTVVFSTFSGFLLSCRSILPRLFSPLSVASCCLADPYYHGRFLHFQWLLVVLSIHTTTVVFFTFSGFLLSCRSILPRSFSSLSVASCCLADPYYHGCFLHFQWLLVVLSIHTTTVVFFTFSAFLLSCRFILLPRLFSSPSVASCCLVGPYYHGCFLHFQWLLVVLSVHTTTVVFLTFSGFLLSCRFILLPRLFSPLSVASCCLAEPYYHGRFLHFQWLLVVLSVHPTTVVFFTFSGFLLSCRSILPRFLSSLSVASCCLVDPYYHGRFLQFQWLLVVLSIHTTTTVVFSTFSGFLLSCRSILPRSFSSLSVASCCLVGPYYHGCFLHFQWLLVVLSVHTTTVFFSTFSGFLLSCRSILPRSFSSLSVASCCLVDPYYHGRFLHFQWLLVVLPIHTTTVVFSTFSGFLLSCRSILPRSFSSLSVASCCLVDSYYYHGCFLHFQWLLVVLSIHTTTTVVFSTFSGFLLSCRSILPRLFSPLSVASCCLVDPYYHGCFLHFQWLLVVLSVHTTTVVFSTFSGFLLSCRSILPRLFSPLSVASCCLVGPYYHGCFLHFPWLLVVLPIHTTTVVFSTFSGFLLSCRFILPRSFSSLSVASCCLVDSYYYHGCFLHFQWLLVVLSVHTTTVVFSTFSGFLLSCRSILPRSFSPLSVASCCLVGPYYHGRFLHFQWLLVVLSVHTTTVVFFTFSGFLLSCRSILPRLFSPLSVASCCLVGPYYHGCFHHFQWLLVVLSVHTTTVVFFTFSGFLLSCRSILPRLFSSLSVASCCLVGPYYHGCFLHFQWRLVVLSIHTTTVVFFTFSSFLLSCRSILPRRFPHFQWLLVVLSIHTTTVDFFTFSGFLLSCRSILPRSFSSLSVASCCFVDSYYYHGCFLHFQWLLVVLSVHTTTVFFSTFSGVLLSCRFILPRSFSSLSVASCCLVDPYYHGRFLHFQWLLVVLSIHTTTVVFFTFSGFLLSCRSILPVYHGRFLHFQWLLVVLPIHTTITVVFSTFSGFLLSCRFILPRLFSSPSVAFCSFPLSNVKDVKDVSDSSNGFTSP